MQNRPSHPPHGYPLRPIQATRHSTFGWSLAFAALGLLAGCADPPPDDDESGEETDALGGVGASGGQNSVFPPGGNVGVGGQPLPGGADGGTGVGPGGTPPPQGGQVGPGGVPAGGDHGMGGQPMGGVPMGGSADRPPQLIAAVVLTETPQIPQSTAQVAITVPAALPNAPGCSPVQINPNAPPAAAAIGYDAGAITVTGVNGAPLMFQPRADFMLGTVYAPAAGLPEDLFADGAMLTAQAAGGAHLAAFSVQVNAPTTVNITEPRAQLGDMQDAGDAMTISWNAGGAESLLIIILPAEGLEFTPEAGTWVFCAAPDTGNFVVPAGTLNSFGDGGDPIFGRPALVSVTRTRLTLVNQGADQIVLTASTTTAAPVSFR